MKKKPTLADRDQSPIPKTKAEADSLRLLETVKETREALDAYYPRLLDNPESEEDAERQADSLKRASANIARALTQTYAISDELSARLKDIRKQRKKKKLIARAPANAFIDLSESQGEHFAKGSNLYKLLLICFIGSFLGVAIEMLWCVIRNGYFESRAGLVWGPFNLLYGAGAVLLTVSLYPIRNHSGKLSFLGGFVVGSLLEYACSFGQEMLLGSRSWDYSAKPFNINGRICLLYSVFWGVLGVLWIKEIYPRMAKWILKIPNKTGKIITVALSCFLLLNSIVSLIAVTRWSQRVEGDAPQNAFWQFIDERFPDERMERIYANMDFSDNVKE